MRSQLLFEQVQSISQLTPVMSAGAVAISLLLMAMSLDEDVLPSIVAWSAALYAALFVGMRGWLRVKRSVEDRKPSANAVHAAFLNSAFLGMVWGVLPILLLPSGDPELAITTGIVMAGVLCASGFALLILPQAALAFSVPLLAGSFVAVVGLEHPLKGLVLAALLTVYALVMGFVCVRHARNLIHLLVSSSKIRDQKDIISLLLKEFEENSSDWLWEFDRGGRFQRVSERFATAAQVSREQLVGLDFHDFLRSIGQESDPILEELRHDIEKHATFSGVEVQISVAGGERFWRLTGKPTFDECGNYAGYIGMASDVTAEKNSERRINYLAHNDALTGLLNRAKFTEHLKQCVARLERYGSPFVVLYLDLDRFKAVNDSRGHLIGDRLLGTGRQAHQVDASRGRHCSSARRRRVCDHPQQQQRCRRDGGPGAAAGRNGQQALRVRRRRRLDRRQHRHRDRTAQRHPARPDPAQCRPRALPGQGRRPPHLPLLRAADGFGRAATPHARSRASPGPARKASSCCTISRSFRPRTTDPAGSRRWCAGTIRSAAVVRAGGVHTDRRTDRPDQADRRLDDPRGLPRRGALAERPAGRGQSLGQALPDVGHRRRGA